MAELEIIGGSASNFVWACRIACGEKGVAYKLNPVMPHTPEVDAIHPFGKIPAMRHGDVALCESRAIITYIDRAFPGPKLVPDDAAAAARIEQWVSIVVTTIDPVWLRRYAAAYILAGPGGPDRAAIDAALQVMEKQFPVMEQAVGAAGHLAGPGFTLADIYFVPVLYYMGKFPESGALLRRFPNLSGYLARQLTRNTIAETVPTAPPGRRG